MKLKVDTISMAIILESMFNSKDSGDQIIGKRSNVMGLSCWYGIEF